MKSFLTSAYDTMAASWPGPALPASLHPAWLGPVADLHPGSIALQGEDDGPVLRLRGDVDADVVEKFEAEPDHAPLPSRRSTSVT